jgi:hypothetical protein
LSQFGDGSCATDVSAGADLPICGMTLPCDKNPR